jgi:class 3 adenylate cyclase
VFTGATWASERPLNDLKATVSGVGPGRYLQRMAPLSARERASLPDRAFAYIDSKGKRRLPIHDEAHVRNALARFDRTHFEDDAARERSRRRLLNAAKRHKIVPVGFIDGQLRSERSGRTPDFSTYPSGAVTFLMTDIEDSTTLVRELADGYTELLRDVRSLIRNAVRRGGGRQVDLHGDEFLAVFVQPGPAVEAAIAVQRGLLERERDGGPTVRVRAGVHSGRPTLTDSGYVGLSLHTVARVCFVGHGGQIVVSRATRSAVQGSLPNGVRLRSLGRHRLSGLPNQELLYQVEAKGLSTRFPPLRVARVDPAV